MRRSNQGEELGKWWNYVDRIVMNIYCILYIADRIVNIIVINSDI